MSEKNQEVWFVTYMKEMKMGHGRYALVRV